MILRQLHYVLNNPSDKNGNAGDATLSNSDDVTVAGSFVDRSITFVRPPVNSEAPQGTWGSATAGDLNRVGSNLYFRKFTWDNAEAHVDKH